MADRTTRDSELNDSTHFPNCCSSFMISRVQLLFGPSSIKSSLQGHASHSHVYSCNSSDSTIPTTSCVAVDAATRLRIGRSGVRFPEGARDFSLLPHVPSSPEAHTVSYSVIPTGSFPQSKAARTEADHLLSLNA